MSVLCDEDLRLALNDPAPWSVGLRSAKDGTSLDEQRPTDKESAGGQSALTSDKTSIDNSSLNKLDGEMEQSRSWLLSSCGLETSPDTTTASTLNHSSGC